MDETLSQETEASMAMQVATGPALAILWSGTDPGRAGEVAAVSGRCTLGRGEGDGKHVVFRRQRPGRNEPRGPLDERWLSRTQLELTRRGSTVEVRNVGKCPLAVNGRRCTEAVVRPGDVLELRKALVLLVVRRPAALPPAPNLSRRDLPAWGQPDASGIVGESPAIWRLRDRVAFLAGRQGHVLVRGESGAGKELVAQALHRGSARSERQLVSRNAATLPPGLVDAELFGNVRGYPNPGMQERPGLVGLAHRSTLFLDEIGEIGEELQAHLLRVLDVGGEYTRLGDSQPRRADIRLVAATNRAPESLKHDLLARLKLRVEVPGLNDRLEDLPLLAHHLLRSAASKDAVLAERFFDGEHPRLHPRLMAGLARHRFRTHVRELDAVLWRSITESEEDRLAAVPLDVQPDAPPSEPAPGVVDVRSLTPEHIAEVLAEHGGSVKETWSALGLKNRFQLIRLLKKHKLGSYGDDG